MKRFSLIFAFIMSFGSVAFAATSTIPGLEIVTSINNKTNPKPYTITVSYTSNNSSYTATVSAPNNYQVPLPTNVMPVQIQSPISLTTDNNPVTFDTNCTYNNTYSAVAITLFPPNTYNGNSIPYLMCTMPN